MLAPRVAPLFALGRQLLVDLTCCTAVCCAGDVSASRVRLGMSAKCPCFASCSAEPCALPKEGLGEVPQRLVCAMPLLCGAGFPRGLWPHCMRKSSARVSPGTCAVCCVASVSLCLGVKGYQLLSDLTMWCSVGRSGPWLRVWGGAALATSSQACVPMHAANWAALLGYLLAFCARWSALWGMVSAS